MDAKPRRLVDIPSLDGLRAISIAIVFVAHAGYEIVPGGLGVSIFFVISGFLITTLLRLEYESTGGVSLKNFYLRRVFRILPIFYCVLILGLIGMSIGLGDGHVDFAATASQFGHYFNFYAITHAGYSIIPGTGIYWSLAIEEHFYLFFPVLILILCRFKLSPFRQGLILLAGCAIVLSWRTYLVYALNATQNRTYYGTDTRLDGLLSGARRRSCSARSSTASGAGRAQIHASPSPPSPSSAPRCWCETKASARAAATRSRPWPS